MSATSTDALAARLAESAARFREDPGAGVTRPSVTATFVNGHARVSSGPFNWESDLGPAVGGGNVAPSPTAYLLGALAGCGALFLTETLAPQLGVRITSVEATASCRADLAGLLGLPGADPALTEIALVVRVTSPDAPERLEAVFAAWRERCPIYLALSGAAPVSLDMAAADAA
jgi:uncharacterized OsmC-like protein